MSIKQEVMDLRVELAKAMEQMDHVRILLSMACGFDQGSVVCGAFCSMCGERLHYPEKCVNPEVLKGDELTREERGRV